MTGRHGLFSSEAYLYRIEGQDKAMMFDRERTVTAELNTTAYSILRAVFDTPEQSPNVILARITQELGLGRAVAEAELGKLMSSLSEAGLVSTVEEIGFVKTPIIRVGKTDPPIVSVMFEITRKCNLDCFYCYNNSSLENARKGELSTAQIFTALDRLKEVGVIDVNFTGGEPLARPDLLEILSYAKRLGFYVVLFSNATLMDDGLIAAFQKLKLDGIRTSLDAGVGSVHDKIRGAHSFEKTTRAISVMKDLGIKVSVSCTISDINREGFNPLLKLMDDLSVDELVIDGVLPIGRSCSMSEQRFTLEQRKKNLKVYKSYYSWALSRSCESSDKMKVSNITRNGGTVVEQRSSGTNTFCGVGDTLLYISSNGNLGFCEVLNEDIGDEYNLGNIITDDLTALWSGSRKVLDFRGSECSRYKSGQCKLSSLCKGGCRARAIIEEKNRNSPDYNSCLHAKAAETALKARESLAVAKRLGNVYGKEK